MFLGPGDKMHTMFEFAAVQLLRLLYPDIFIPDTDTMCMLGGIT